MISLKKRILWIALLLLVGQMGKAQFKLEGPYKSELIPFKFIKNLMVIPLMINGKGVFNFILDTGVGVMLISDPTLMDTLGLSNLRKIKVSGFGEGKELEASVTGNLSIKINNAIEGSCPAAVLQEDAFDLSSYTGIPIHGLIGYEFFSSFTVRINYLEQTLRVYRPWQPFNLRKSSLIPIAIHANKPYLMGTLTMQNESAKSIRLIIDTGAGHPLWLERIDQQAIHIPEPNIRANLGVGLTGTIDGYMSRIPVLKLGKYALKNIVTAFPDYDDVGVKIEDKRNGNLGNAILKRFEVVFDYRRGAIQLKPNYYFKTAFEHDMSGMELVYHAPDYNRLFIGRVENGSAADDCGIEAGDELLRVNFKAAKDWSIDELHELFRSRDKKSILISILPRGEKNAQTVVLTLKRRI